MNTQKGLLVLAVIALLSDFAPAARAARLSAPCSGPSGLLGLLDRPTVGDSSCVVPDGMTVLEAGATAGSLYGAPGGKIDTLPNLELRWGLPDNSEFVWLPPDFQYQPTNAGPHGPAATTRGFGATTIGIKHEFGHTAHWQWTAEALTTLPSGSNIFGSRGFGEAVNGIVSYGNGPLGVSLMAGYTSETEPTAAGGQRYQSFNPDLVATWQSSARLQLYAEVYAQSHVGYHHGWGTDADGGVQYLVDPDFEVDLEEGVRIQGALGGFSNYTGVGLGLLF